MYVPNLQTNQPHLERSSYVVFKMTYVTISQFFLHLAKTYHQMTAQRFSYYHSSVCRMFLAIEIILLNLVTEQEYERRITLLAEAISEYASLLRIDQYNTDIWEKEINQYLNPIVKPFSSIPERVCNVRHLHTNLQIDHTYIAY